MLAGERAAVGGDQPRGLPHEIAPIGEPRFGAEVEIDPAVDETVADMAVDGGFIAVAMHQRLEVAQIIAELLARPGAVLPPFPAFRRSEERPVGTKCGRTCRSR